ncbi:MAG: iron ABC transporter permease [Alphaproteobacteria bacterium]|nr:iron ABC transporter permease [Alphaproteobacteria bacterium]
MLAGVSQRWHRVSVGERLWLAGLVLAILAISLWPLARLAMELVGPGLAVAERVLARPQTWTATLNTLTLSGSATLVALLLGGGMALLLGTTDLPRRDLIAFAFLIPLVIPPQITAVAWMQVLGPGSVVLAPLGLAPASGTANPLYSATGIAILLGVEQAPLVFLTVRAGLAGIPRDLVEAARSAGASPTVVLRTILVPLLLPFFAAGAALAFAAAAGNFGIPAVLGIPARVPVLPTLIYQRLSGFGPRVLPEVAMLSMVLAVVVGSALAVQALCLRGRRVPLQAGAGLAPMPLGRWRTPLLVLVALVLASLLVAPMVALIGGSLAPALGVAPTWETVSLAGYRFILFEHDASHRALQTSLLLSGMAAILLAMAAVPLAHMLAAQRSWTLRAMVGVAELPYALPGTVLAVGCILAFLPPLPGLGVSLYATFWLLLIAYLARFLPLALRPVVSAAARLDRGLDEAARLAQAGFTRRLWTITLPAVAPAAAAGAILVFLIAMNELTVSALLWSAGWETLGVVVFSLEQGGAIQAASALAVLIIAMTVLGMLAADRLRHRLPSGVLPWRG